MRMKLFLVSNIAFLIHGALAFGSNLDAKLTIHKLESLHLHRRGTSFDEIEVSHHLAKVNDDTRTETFEIHNLELRHDLVSTDKQKKLSISSLGVALGSLSSVAIAAKAGILSLDTDFEYTDALILRDVGSTVFTAITGYFFVKLVTSCATNGIVEPSVSRKLIHTFSAPMYLCLLPLFTPAGRFFAACVPFINTFRLYAAANGDLGEADLARAISRTGDKNEALGGPFIYTLVMLAAVSLFWRDNLIGITALCTMAAGDGMADIIGRRWGKQSRWFFSESKSVVGSLAFWISATLCTTGLAVWLSFAGCLVLPFELGELSLRIAVVTGVCAMIELLPVGDDNWNVPIGASILAAIFLQ